MSLIPPDVWADQEEFNALVNKPVHTDEEKITRTKDFALHQISEVFEMLNALGVWASHRKMRPDVNMPNVRRQLIDQFKYWMSIAQLWGITPQELEDTYWQKSATVRQRFSEDFIVSLDRPIAVLDLDGVLADYYTGFSQWFAEWALLKCDVESHAISRIKELAKNQEFFSAESLGVTTSTWVAAHSAFCSGGGFASLPVMPGAAKLTHWLRKNGYAVVAMTSRPIDEFPNIYDDTLFWLKTHQCWMDCIWWGHNKAERLAKMLPTMKNIFLVVEDDPRYVQQFVQARIPRIYHKVKKVPNPAVIPQSSIRYVDSLQEVIDLEAEHV